MQSYCHHGYPKKGHYCRECEAEYDAAALARKVVEARELLASHGNRHERRAAKSKARTGKDVDRG